MTDILIENGRILTPSGWSEPGYLTIEAGKITAFETGTPSAETYASTDQIISADGMAVLPGLTNAHTHLSQTFMRGLSDGRPLLRWLKELIWPLQEAMNLEELHLAALLGLVENIRSGVTQIVDHQKITRTLDYSLAVCSAAEQCGTHLTLARGWADQGSNAENPQNILKELEYLFERYQANKIINISSGPLTPWRATDDTLKKTHALAQQYGGSTHIHVSETMDEVKMSQNAYGMLPVEWLDSIGVLGPDTQIVHAVWVSEEEIALLQKRHVLVIHCPISNAILGSGTAPIFDMQQLGVRLHLGTDGPASNDTQDSFENMKTALLLAHVRASDPTQLSPSDILQMATTGKTLSKGEPADLILVNLRNVNAAPVHNIDPALVLSCHGSDVDSVIIDGKLIMHQKRILIIDEAALIKECEQAAKNLRKRLNWN
jgi:5-methylthioadenosine/S-adenosylhomocysteine deaminase